MRRATHHTEQGRYGQIEALLVETIAGAAPLDRADRASGTLATEDPRGLVNSRFPDCDDVDGP
jgi:hypothetical protein